MTENERCPECGSWGEECAFPSAQASCGCARCLRASLDEARASVAHFRNAVREKERLELEAVQKLDEARAMLSAICSEFEGAVAHADWRAAGSPGMSVPFTGDFASATQLPSVVGRMRWWAREMRKSIGEKKS